MAAEWCPKGRRCWRCSTRLHHRARALPVALAAAQHVHAVAHARGRRAEAGPAQAGPGLPLLGARREDLRGARGMRARCGRSACEVRARCIRQMRARCGIAPQPSAARPRRPAHRTRAAGRPAPQRTRPSAPRASACTAPTRRTPGRSTRPTRAGRRPRPARRTRTAAPPPPRPPRARAPRPSAAPAPTGRGTGRRSRATPAAPAREAVGRFGLMRRACTGRRCTGGGGQSRGVEPACSAPVPPATYSLPPSTAATAPARAARIGRAASHSGPAKHSTAAWGVWSPSMPPTTTSAAPARRVRGRAGDWRWSSAE